MKELIGEIEKWSEKYDITFQFWKNNNTVYIEVDLVDLVSLLVTNIGILLGITIL